MRRQLHFLLCFLSLPLAIRLRAQQLQPAANAAFDGQQVSRVEIAANSGVDSAAMRRLIQQQALRAFSSEAIRQSVAALQQTHEFTSVNAYITPEQNGLLVLFVLDPADYIGVVDFPGVGTKAAYTSLLQAANVPEQSPFYPGLETDGANGVLDYLHKLGYLAAEVHPAVQRDEQRHIANLTFSCTLNAQARISAVEFTGLSEPQSDEARKSLRGLWARLKRVSLRPGQKYSEQRALKAIPLVRDRLRTPNQLAPSIRLASAAYQQDTNRVDVSFRVTPGLHATVEVHGAHVSNRTLRRLVPVYSEGTVDQDLVDEGRGNLEAHFQTKGYFNATTDAHLAQVDSSADVTYDVNLGSKYRVKAVSFAGNQHFSDKQLLPQVSVKRGFLFLHGTYSEQLLNKSTTALTQKYKNDGYSEVSIRPEVKNVDSAIRITFRVQEGAQDKVASLQVTGNKTQSQSELSRKYPPRIQVGGPYSTQLMDAGQRQLQAAYLDLGYVNAEVRSSASPVTNGSHEMKVIYNVEEGPQAKISEVVVLGTKTTKTSFVRDVTKTEVQSGQPLSQGDFLRAESDLYDLGIFDWASIRSLRPVIDQTEEPALIKVHESPKNSMDIGGGLEIMPRDGNVPVNSVIVPGIPPISLGNKFTVSQDSFIGPRFVFDFSRHDLLGKAETATIGTALSRLDQRVFFTYADPRFSGFSWSSLFSLSVERTTENPVYAADLGNVSFQLEKHLDPKKTKHVIARYSFQQTDLSNVLISGLVLPEDLHVRLSALDGEFLRDTRDKPLDAHKGVYQTFDFGITATPLGASASFVRFLGQTAFYRPVKPWLVWASNFRLGLAQPFSGSFVPLSEEFFSGGPDSLRGFPIDGAGPQRPIPVCSNPSNSATCTLISVPVGGDMLFIVNSEARFPLPISTYRGLGGAVFYDGGNVYSSLSLKQFADDFTHTVGAGIRYQTPVGPVRFDVGYRLTAIPGVKAIQYFVTLGQSF